MLTTIRQVFVSRMMFLMLLMGFSSGLPLALTGTGGTLQAWMTDEGVDLKTVGIFAIMGLPYALKFLWAPFIDRFSLPFLGLRRGWMLITQLFCIALVLLTTLLSPANQIGLVAWMALLLAFVSASQDIVIDAYRAETLAEQERGAGAAVSILGYRLGMLASGAIALILADILSWRLVYSFVALMLLSGVIATALAPEPHDSRQARSLSQALIEPFRQFFSRRGSLEILVFVVLYNLGYVMAVALLTRFLMDLGFSKTDIGFVAKTFGLIASILGALTAGAVLARISLYRALLLFGVLQIFSVLGFALLASMGQNFYLMAAAIGLENFCAGMSTAALAAMLMGLCNKGSSATQYALLTSLTAVARTFAGAATGFMAVYLGWTMFFIVCALMAVPALILVTRFPRWQAS